MLRLRSFVYSVAVFILSTLKITEGCSGGEDTTTVVMVITTGTNLTVSEGATSKNESSSDTESLDPEENNAEDSPETSNEDTTKHEGKPNTKDRGETEHYGAVSNQPHSAETGESSGKGSKTGKTSSSESTGKTSKKPNKTSKETTTTETMSTTTEAPTTSTTIEDVETALVVIGGFTNDPEHSLKGNVEVSIKNGTVQCIAPSFPTPIQGHSAGNLGIGNKKLLVCGGFKDGKEVNDKCYSLDYAKMKWTEAPTMLVPRANAAFIVRADYGLLVTGGIDSAGNVLSDTELIGTTGNAWERRANFSTPHSGSCLVHWDQTHTYLIQENKNEVWVYDWEKDEWADTKNNLPRGGSSPIGLSLGVHNIFIVLTHERTISLSLKEDKMWRVGYTYLPFKVSRFYLTLYMGKSTVIGGKSDKTDYGDWIFQFDPDGKTKWITTSMKLKHGRNSHFAIEIKSFPCKHSR